MSTLNNTTKNKAHTHEGGKAAAFPPAEELRRAVMCCMLWEDQFYEDGISIADRIADLVPKVGLETCANIAVKARTEMHLRHVPLLIVTTMARQRWNVENVLATIIQRPDELTEFLAVYWKDGRCPLSASVKKGLARAFRKFDAYSLAKYNRTDKPIKLCDVLFLCHAKPHNGEQAATWKQLVDGTLATPDTWETELSKGNDKFESWTRLLKANKLGSMALVRNLRNMEQAKVRRQDINTALLRTNPGRMLPYRFIAAAKHAVGFEPEIEQLLFKCCAGEAKLPGHTTLLIDVSYSMQNRLSQKSEMNRLDAACGLAILLREICESVTIYTFSNEVVQVPGRRGFALRDVITTSQIHRGTKLGAAVTTMKAEEFYADRCIVLTDEQSQDDVSAGTWKHSWMINVASNQHGVALGAWRKINGWSNAITRYISRVETQNR